jgi:hypothetical protein
MSAVADDATKSAAVEDDVVEKDLEHEKGREPSGPRIRCPLCGWVPRKHDVWMCSCKHLWNTFDTGGVCPACLHQWAVTQCRACHKFSPHSDWYEE